MKSTSVKLSDSTDELLSNYASDNHNGNRSEALRALIHKGIECDDRITALETDRDRLQRELRATNARQDDIGEVVEYVEHERAIQERERERRDAPIWKRGYWFVFGR